MLGLSPRRIGLCALCFWGAGSALAQERDTLPIDQVTVYGNRINRQTIPVQSLSGNTLQQLNVHSVADAIRYFSGVQVKDYGGIGGLKTVNVRSMGSHHVGVFYDGVELGNAQNGVVDLGRFSLDNMESIALYNGQKSAIFQSAKDYASASAIYMTTRRPSWKGQKRYRLNLGLKGGSFATINPSVLWEQKISDRISTSISSEFLSTSGEYPFSYATKGGYDTTEIRRNGDVRAARAEAALFGTLNQGEWTAKVYYYNSERGYPGASVREEPGKFKHQDRQWDDNLFVQGSFRQQFGRHYSLLVHAKYAYDYLHYRSDPRADVSTMYVDNHYRQQEVYGSTAHLFSILPWWSASLAIDFQWNTLNADLVHFVYPSRYALWTAAATSMQFKKVQLQASLLHTYIKDVTQTEGGNADQKSVWSPTVALSYQPFDKVGLNLRAFYKRAYRMPTLNDLYYTFVGNINLKPESAHQYNLGLTYTLDFASRTFPRLELQADGYFNQVQDKIIAMPTSNQFRWTMLNLGYVEIRGLDASVQAWAAAGAVSFSLRLNYTYQQAEERTDPDSKYYGGQIPYVPWHSGSAILHAQYRGWSVHYSFLYTGERYESVANIPENYARPWYTHDIALSKTIPLRSMELRCTAEVSNLLNQPYEVVKCYPMPGTNFKLKINLIL